MVDKCQRCGSAKAEVYLRYARLSLCKNCFQEYYVKRVRRTVEEFKMFRENDKVGVAVSGGKDSAALFHSLRRAFPNLRLTALHVNLGIPEYSEHCQKKAEALANLLNADMYVFDLQKETGVTLTDFRETLFKRRICSVCGIIKRHAFEELAHRANVKVLATGHNLEDMVGIMLNNFFSSQWSQLVRLKPVLQPFTSNLTLKVKPLIRTPERESLLYCLYSHVPFREMECPYARGTKIKENLQFLEMLSKNKPHFKHQALNTFLKLIPLLEEKIEKPRVVPCKICGFPSITGVCAYCKKIALVREAKNRR